MLPPQTQPVKTMPPFVGKSCPKFPRELAHECLDSPQFLLRGEQATRKLTRHYSALYPKLETQKKPQEHAHVQILTKLGIKSARL